MKNINEIYYVDHIGYCFKWQQPKQIPLSQLPSLTPQVPSVQKPIKKDSFYFESQLFKVNELQAKILSNKIEQTKKQTQLIQNRVQKKVQKQQQKILKLKLARTSVLVYACQSLIKKSINLNIKPLFGIRTSINIQVNITTTIDNLKKFIFEKLAQNIATYHNIRIFYPSYTLFQLATATKTIADQLLPSNAKLVLLASRTFSIQPPKTLGSIKMQNSNLTISKVGDNLYTTLMGNVGFQKSGRFYWEVKLDNFSDEEDLFLGVAQQNIDLNTCPTCSGNYWGYMPIFSKKFSPQENSDLIQYGYPVKIGDSIGILLEFINGVANLIFYKNGISLGNAYSGLQGKLFPVITLFGYTNTVIQVTIDPKSPCPLPDRF